MIRFLKTSAPGWPNRAWTVCSGLTGNVRVGEVRRSADPPHRSRPWGYVSKTLRRYPNGMTVDAGYATRREAAQALADFVLDETINDPRS